MPAEECDVNAVDLRVCSLVDLDRPLCCASRNAVTLAGEATAVMVRPGSVSTREMIERMRQLKASLGESPPVLVVGRVDVALAAELAGVLLGRSDMTPTDARRLLGPRALVGMEVHEPAHADELYRWPVDFALIGRTGPHSSPTPLDAQTVGRISFRVRLAAPGTATAAFAAWAPGPAELLIGAGADGIVCPAPDPGSADAPAPRLRARIDEALTLRRQFQRQ
jgi:thiamine-phosphate pyrophosphorylase